MKARVKLAEGMTFVAESGSGHAIVIDAAPDIGGRNLGPRPMELLLMGLGGCTSIDVMLILRRAREKVVDCVVELDADRAPTDPKVFTEIRMRYVVSGHGLDRAKVERAIKLSEDKYCSATAILSGTAKITHTLDLVEIGDGSAVSPEG